MIHKDSDEGGLAELKGKAKRQWGKFNDKPLDSMNVNRDNVEGDLHHIQKNKKTRADKHLQEVQDILQVMSKSHNKTTNRF